MNKQPLYTVYRIAWDGEPSMSGTPHVMSVGREFDSYEDAAAAIARTSLKDKPGVHIQSRWATDWENATA
jgi:hypothetical protein